ncbi:MAG TPA: hypothetical protein VL027_08245 [Spongiibacteraceae bacterium]|jgi:hypothetical protein|nr:hypothetical protein [Spongiibacteraceae bacterium]HUH37919.1 hypothetical protein [Spongiibacteraceae bacterium]
MKTLFGSLLALCMTTAVFAECQRPSAPALPEGASADMPAMVEGQAAVKAFVADGNAYLECLQAEAAALKEAGKGEDEEAAAARLASYNGMVDEMNAVAGQFNAEIKVFKARQ